MKRSSTAQESFSSIQERSFLSDKHGGLLSRLMMMQVDLTAKINSLRQQKIKALERYNKEYDRFSILSIQKTKISLRQSSTRTQQIENSQPQLFYKSPSSRKNTEEQNMHQARQSIKQDQVTRQLEKNEETKLKSLLQQLYELKQVNDYQQSLLTAVQLQQLDGLLKTEYSDRETYYGTHEIDKQIQKISINQESNRTSVQQIISINRLNQLLKTKVSQLESFQKSKLIYQSQSVSKVYELEKKKLFLSKQLEKMNNILKQMEMQHIKHKQFLDSANRQEPNENKLSSLNMHSPSQQQLVKRWQKIQYYFQLKSKLNQRQKQQKSQTQNSQNKLNQLKQPTNDQQEERKLKENIQLYEQYIQSQRANKIQLHKQLQSQNSQYQTLITQNQILQSLVELI